MAPRLAALTVVGVLAATAALGACGADEDDTAGYGHVEVSDLPDDGAGHFTAEPAPITGRLVLHENGCVNVLVDGVERHPLWPDGTTVVDEGEGGTGNGRYVVTFSTGVTLHADPTAGDSFTAQGVVDDAAVPLAQSDAQGKVGSLIVYCEAPGEPVAFADATTIARVEG
ncbi:MAG: hypothetical protein NVV70_02195 [Cellulomonas sp.]|nr:hypothetical protein [Cellulomonas sp.]MCR6646994.1 hypothetical protein [Cellulomonas sp.]